MEMDHARAQVFKNCPDLKIYTQDGYEIPVTEIRVDENGQINSILTSEELFLRDDVAIYNNFLPVPGVGYLRPGTEVIYKNKEYSLQFGWHKNISNQVLFTWYLDPIFNSNDTYDHSREYMSPPIESRDCITVTFDMIDQLNKFCV